MTIGVRVANLEDLPGIAKVALATEQSLIGGGADSAYAGLLLVHGRLVVATVDERVVGFGATIPLNFNGAVVEHLTDLFVHPDMHGQGVGRAVLDLVWSAAPERSTFSSSHPSALPLYVRAGMRPWWPLVYVEGPVAELPAGGRRLDVIDVSVEVAVDLEMEWGDGDRSVEHAYWLSRPTARVVVVREAGEALGVAALRNVDADLKVSHLRVADPAAAAEVLLALLRLGHAGAHVAVPGPSPALPMLMMHGWRVVDVDFYMATSPGLLDPATVFPHAGLV